MNNLTDVQLQMLIDTQQQQMLTLTRTEADLTKMTMWPAVSWPLSEQMPPSMDLTLTSCFDSACMLLQLSDTYSCFICRHWHLNAFNFTTVQKELWLKWIKNNKALGTILQTVYIRFKVGSFWLFQSQGLNLNVPFAIRAPWHWNYLPEAIWLAESVSNLFLKLFFIDLLLCDVLFLLVYIFIFSDFFIILPLNSLIFNHHLTSL